MAILEQWENTLSQSVVRLFSPSGHAVAFTPLYEAPDRFLNTLEIRFVDHRPSLKVEADGMVLLRNWASDTEFVYIVAGEPLGKLSDSTLWLLSLETGISSQISVESEYEVHTESLAQTGRQGHLSVLVRREDDTSNLFDFDVRAGTMVRLDAFNGALQDLEVFPLFGHSWSEERQEVALIARRHSDYLEARTEGAATGPGELAQKATLRKAHRLFILSAAGDCQEVPGTIQAHDPHWSPDGSLISYKEYVFMGDSGVFLARRDDFALLRLGTSPVMAKTLMHPSGILLAELEGKSLPVNENIPPRARMTPKRWHAFRVQGGEVSRP